VEKFIYIDLEVIIVLKMTIDLSMEVDQSRQNRNRSVSDRIIELGVREVGRVDKFLNTHEGEFLAFVVLVGSKLAIDAITEGSELERVILGR
jgi:hypothetical protein